MIDWSIAKDAVRHRYVIRQDEDAAWDERFSLYDTLLRRRVYASSSIALTVTQAQRRNGFALIDGNSRTYLNQIKEKRHENGR